jgi:hypothetical protein
MAVEMAETDRSQILNQNHSQILSQSRNRNRNHSARP